MEAQNGNANGAGADEQEVEFADTVAAESKDLTQADVPENDELTDTGIFKAETEASDNVGMSSVQFDVEELISEFEAEAPQGVDKDGRLRKRLDAILERKRRHEEILDFDDYDLDS